MGDPGDLARKRQLIIDYEKSFAQALAARVIEKPVLSIWMILLPILLVHYFYRHQKFKAGTTEFAAQYIKPRMKALDFAAGLYPPETSSSPVPAPSEDFQNRLQDSERAYISIVADHFRRLLGASGDDYPSLVRSAYGDERQYNQYVTDNSDACTAINDVVLDADDPAEEFREIVRHMEMVLRGLHRHETDRLFPK